MNDEMEENIKNKNNCQYFLDTRYYATPPNSKQNKMVEILAFNKADYKTVICNLSIISNENKEIFLALFEYLRNRYNWQPKLITIDYSIPELTSIFSVFPKVTILPCFFHFIKNIIKKLPQLKSRNNNVINTTRNLLSNIKLLCFIPLSIVQDFYEKINNKFGRKKNF